MLLWFKRDRFVILLALIICMGLLFGCEIEPDTILPTTYTLTVLLEGEGAATPPEGQHEYDEGVVVDVLAEPFENWEFKEWVGDVTNNDLQETTIVMDDNKTITAIFEEKKEPSITYTLSMMVEGEGAVSPHEGQHEYDEGVVVKLVATPFEGWVFDRWEGEVADSKAMETTIIMERDLVVTAFFVEEESEYIPSDPGERISYNLFNMEFFMRLAPAATFSLGALDNEEATVEQAFYVAETQVTYALWYRVKEWAEENGYSFANVGREGSHGPIGEAPTAGNHEPLTRASWYDSIVFCNALSAYFGYDPVYTYEGVVIKDATDRTAGYNAQQEDTNGFRLPTSEEWELAARYRGSDDSYGAIEYPPSSGEYWTPGNYASGARADYNDEDATREAAWYFSNSDVEGAGNTTQNVGQKPIYGNGLGVFDMSGNVWEWCFTQSGSYRINRGGGFGDTAFRLQVGFVRDSSPTNSYDNQGFRLVRTDR